MLTPAHPAATLMQYQRTMQPDYVEGSWRSEKRKVANGKATPIGQMQSHGALTAGLDKVKKVCDAFLIGDRCICETICTCARTKFFVVAQTAEEKDETSRLIVSLGGVVWASMVPGCVIIAHKLIAAISHAAATGDYDIILRCRPGSHGVGSVGGNTGGSWLDDCLQAKRRVPYQRDDVLVVDPKWYGALYPVADASDQPIFACTDATKVELDSCSDVDGDSFTRDSHASDLIKVFSRIGSKNGLVGLDTRDTFHVRVQQIVREHAERHREYSEESHDSDVSFDATKGAATGASVSLPDRTPSFWLRSTATDAELGSLADTLGIVCTDRWKERIRAGNLLTLPIDRGVLMNGISDEMSPQPLAGASDACSGLPGTIFERCIVCLAHTDLASPLDVLIPKIRSRGGRVARMSTSNNVEMDEYEDPCTHCHRNSAESSAGPVRTTDEALAVAAGADASRQAKPRVFKLASMVHPNVCGTITQGGMPITVGRAQDNTLVVPSCVCDGMVGCTAEPPCRRGALYPTVSRNHLIVSWPDGYDAPMINHLKPNFINDSKTRVAAPTPLAIGDLITLGESNGRNPCFVVSVSDGTPYFPCEADTNIPKSTRAEQSSCIARKRSAAACNRRYGGRNEKEAKRQKLCADDWEVKQDRRTVGEPEWAGILRSDTRETITHVIVDETSRSLPLPNTDAHAQLLICVHTDSTLKGFVPTGTL